MKINRIFNVPLAKGEVGIEIEVEGLNLPTAVKGWRKVGDGSLRGEETGEFVLRYPCSRQDVDRHLYKIARAYQECNTVLDHSDRTSVHVHINMQSSSITKIFNFIVMFLLFEEMLVHFCGDTREGNLFCLRSCDAEFLITALERASQSQEAFRSLRSDNLRYAAINVNSLAKYGSLEFRSMRGTSDMSLIKQWIDILLGIKDAAIAYRNPIEILEGVSMHSPRGLVEEVFGQNANIIFDYPNWESILWKQLRNLQVLAYEGEWLLFNFIDSPEEDV